MRNYTKIKILNLILAITCLWQAVVLAHSVPGDCLRPVAFNERSEEPGTYFQSELLGLLPGGDVNPYKGPTAYKKITCPDPGKDPVQYNQKIREIKRLVAADCKVIPVEIEGVGTIRFEVDKQLFPMTNWDEKTLEGLLRWFIKARGPGKYAGLEPARTITIAVLDKSANLFEDHRQNRFIGINKILFKVAQRRLITLLMIGLTHELRHEAGETAELKLTREDIDLFLRASSEGASTEEGRYDNISVAIEELSADLGEITDRNEGFLKNAGDLIANNDGWLRSWLGQGYESLFWVELPQYERALADELLAGLKPDELDQIIAISMPVGLFLNGAPVDPGGIVKTIKEFFKRQAIEDFKTQDRIMGLIFKKAQKIKLMAALKELSKTERQRYSRNTVTIALQSLANTDRNFAFEVTEALDYAQKKAPAGLTKFDILEAGVKGLGDFIASRNLTRLDWVKEIELGAVSGDTLDELFYLLAEGENKELRKVFIEGLKFGFISQIAKAWSEERCAELSERLAKELKISKDDLSAIGAYSYKQIGYGKEDSKWETYGSYFIRIGHLFFMDKTNALRLSDGLRADLGANFIILEDLGNSVLNDENLNRFTVAAIVTMFSKNIIGKHVIDCGAGEGILSLVAFRLGAQSADLIELSPELLGLAGRNLKLNALTVNKNYRLIQGDLKNTDDLVRRITPTDTEIVMLSNIGTWEGLYNVTNADSIRLAQFIPHVTSFIAGGYNIQYGYSYNAFRKDNFHIASLGYDISISSPYPDNPLIRTWIAMRQRPGAELISRAFDLIDNTELTKDMFREAFVVFNGQLVINYVLIVDLLEEFFFAEKLDQGLELLNGAIGAMPVKMSVIQQALLELKKRFENEEAIDSLLTASQI